MVKLLTLISTKHPPTAKQYININNEGNMDT